LLLPFDSHSFRMVAPLPTCCFACIVARYAV
jgi:hypothetical protein